jgi:hypothetical protein
VVLPNVSIGQADQLVFWSRVLSIAESLETPGVSASEADGLLLGLEEGFPELLDPVEHFEAFAVLRLCRALRHRG